MSKELEFESDRLEKRRKRKSFLLPIGILAGVLAVVFIIALIIGANKKEAINKGEGTAFPYTWVYEKNGNATLSISTGSKGDSYQWRYTGPRDEKPCLNVEKDSKQDKGSTSFTLTSVEEGSIQLDFVLEKNDNQNDRIGEASIVVEVIRTEESDKLTISPLREVISELAGYEEGTATDSIAYNIFSGDDRVTIVINDGFVRPTNPPRPTNEYGEELLPSEGTNISDEVPDVWDGTSDNTDVVDFGGLLEDENGVLTAYFIAGSGTGVANVRLFNDRYGFEVKAQIEITADGSIKVNSHSGGTY